MSKAFQSFVIALAVFCILIATSTQAQRGPQPNAWTEEHSGYPYVGAVVHYVLPEGFKNAGHPRAAIITLVGAHQRVDLQVELSPKDVEPGQSTVIAVENVKGDGGGDFNTWHWPPDPRDFRTTGQ